MNFEFYFDIMLSFCGIFKNWTFVARFTILKISAFQLK